MTDKKSETVLIRITDDEKKIIEVDAERVGFKNSSEWQYLFFEN